MTRMERFGHRPLGAAPQAEGVRTAYRRQLREERIAEVWDWVRALCLAVAFAMLLRTCVFEVTRVKGPSMQNTLFSDQRIAVFKLEYWFSQPKRFEVVICRFPGQDGTFVKRVIGLPGDEIKIENGSLIINSWPVEENYIAEQSAQDFGPIIVPDDSFFVIGDNRNRSTDSRYEEVGSIPKERILGRVIAIVYPLGQVQWIDHKSELRQRIQEQSDWVEEGSDGATDQTTINDARAYLEK